MWLIPPIIAIMAMLALHIYGKRHGWDRKMEEP